MSSPLTPSERRIIEGTTPTYWAVIKDEQNPPQPIALANIDDITVTLYVVNSDGTTTIVGGRNKQGIRNENNVSIHDTSGLLTWSLQVEDTTLVDDSLKPGDIEPHLALFEFTYAGTKRGKYLVQFDIIQTLRVP